MASSEDTTARKRKKYSIPREYRRKVRRKPKKVDIVKKYERERQELERKKLESLNEETLPSLQSDSTIVSDSETISCSKGETSINETCVVTDKSGTSNQQSDEESNSNQQSTLRNSLLEESDLEIVKPLVATSSVLDTSIGTLLSHPNISSKLSSSISNKPSSLRNIALQTIDFEIVKPFVNPSSVITFSSEVDTSSSNVSSTGNSIPVSSPLSANVALTSVDIDNCADISTFDELIPELHSMSLLAPVEEFACVPDEDIN